MVIIATKPAMIQLLPRCQPFDKESLCYDATDSVIKTNQSDSRAFVTLVSWEAPSEDGGSPIEAYPVRWKSGSEEYDTSRQAVVTDLTSPSHGF